MIRRSGRSSPVRAPRGRLPERDFGGVRGDFTFPRSALHGHWTGAWWGNFSARIVGIGCSFALQPAHDAPQLPSCRYHVNCARLLRGSHDGNNSQFNSGMVLRAWNSSRLPLSGATYQCRQLRKTLRGPVRDANTGNLSLVPNSFFVMTNSAVGSEASLAITK